MRALESKPNEAPVAGDLHLVVERAIRCRLLQREETMMLGEYKFVPKRDVRLEELADEIQGLLGALERNGQIWGDEVIGRVGGAVHVILSVPRVDALATANQSEWVKQAESRVRALCGEEPRWSVVDDRAAEPVVERWRRSESLYLFTHVLDRTSPIFSGTDGQPVPSYLIDLGQEERAALIAWAAEYRRLDGLQLGCGPLEVPAYTQLASPDAAHALEGRRLARLVERATKKRTYYYLVRHWGKEQGEEDRLCPGCGSRWFVRAEEGGRGLAWFDFRCDRCRLVSHLAVSFESPELASIGEWRPGQRPGGES